VQGAGGAAGIIAGAVGLLAFSRARAATVLMVAVLANALGFAIQVAWTTPASLLLGAALAGIGIQAITMAAAPFLTRHSTAEDRVSVFAAHALALQAIPGALGALTAGYAERAAVAATGSIIDAHRLALAVGALAVAFAFAPIVRVRSVAVAADAAPRRGLRDRAKVARLLTPDLLVFAANGLSVPFLQIYFERRFGLSAAAVGTIYAMAMVSAIVPHFVSPSLAKRLGAERTTMLTHGAAGLAFCVLALAAHPVLAAAAFIARQVATSAAVPLYTSVLHTRVHADDSARTASYRMIAQSIAWASANFAAGPMLESFGFGAVLASAAIAHFVAVGVEQRVFASSANA
jgi:hypothetical protein